MAATKLAPVHTFMDALPEKSRSGAAHLYSQYSFSELFAMRYEKIPEMLQRRFPLAQHEWHQMLEALILTKATHFEINDLTPPFLIDGIRQSVARVLKIAPEQLDAALLHLRKQHPEFCIWLETLVAERESA